MHKTIPHLATVHCKLQFVFEIQSFKFFMEKMLEISFNLL